MIAPDELRAESAYAAHNVEGFARRFSRRRPRCATSSSRLTEQVHQAESNLASIEAQQAAATADLESARLNFERTQNLSREGVAAAQELDERAHEVRRPTGRGSTP